MARQYSDDPQTAENGGYVGEVELTALEDTYRMALADLSPGEVSEVMRTQHGFQILRLASRQASRKPRLDEARDWIRGVIEARRREKQLAEWLDRAREEIYVKVMGL